jgi:hypothetical protein
MPRRLAAILAWLVLASGCRRSEPALITAVPAGTTALAGLELNAIRSSPLYPKLPPAAAGLLDPVRDASTMLFAWNGSDLLLLAHGNFKQPPSGYSMIGEGIAAAGALDRIEAAQSQIRSGQTGSPDLAGHAPAAPIWTVVKGNGKLPLAGNLANANNLLRDAAFTVFSAQLRERVDWSVTAECPAPENARRFEQSLRALVTLAAAATARQPDLAAMLRSVSVTRDDRIVRVNGAASPEALLKLF